MLLAIGGGGGRVLLGASEFAGNISQDGRSLTYVLRADGGDDPGILDLATGAKKRVTITPENEGGAEFTPDGASLVFRRVTATLRLKKGGPCGVAAPADIGSAAGPSGSTGRDPG
jgi:hypothetical protein